MITYRRRLVLIAAGVVLGGCDGDRKEQVTEPAMVLDEMVMPTSCTSSCMDDATYLYRLGLMRGHLFVGNALFDLGERNAAGTHSKHPTSELYAPMGVEFAARGSTGFATELQAHADAVSDADDETVAARYADLVVAIAESEDAIDISTGLVVKVINHLIREAAREYAIGIVDGKLANAHEYQDAYGFTQVALLWAQRARSIASENEVPVFNRIVARLEGLGDMWPALVPPDEVPHTAERLYGTAADIGIIALDLRR